MSQLRLPKGAELEALKQEWAEEGLIPELGSIENDLLLGEWESWENPACIFKSAGLYKQFRDVIYSKRVSGTFYHISEEWEHFEHLQPGDTVDYRSQMTNWFNESRTTPGVVTFKLSCDDVPGLRTRDVTVLGECRLTVTARDGDLVTVAL